MTVTKQCLLCTAGNWKITKQ